MYPYSMLDTLPAVSNDSDPRRWPNSPRTPDPRPWHYVAAMLYTQAPGMYSAKVIANVIEEFKWVFLLLQLMENYEFSLNC